MNRLSYKTITNAGKYRHKIQIYRPFRIIDTDGFPRITKGAIFAKYADIKTTKGITILRNNSDFEKAYTNFIIRYPKIPITRDMLIEYNGKTYSIEYINNVNEANVELEIQAKEITH